MTGTLYFVGPISKESRGLYRNVINKATDYIGRNMDGRLDDPYAIALAAYALQLAGHPLKETAFNLLESKANSKGNFNDLHLIIE
jgi:hypothetical protein